MDCFCCTSVTRENLFFFQRQKKEKGIKTEMYGDEFQFFFICYQLNKINLRKDNRLKMVEEHDKHNNSFLAGMALDDVHREGQEETRLYHEGLKIKKRIGPARADRIFQQALALFGL